MLSTSEQMCVEKMMMRSDGHLGEQRTQTHALLGIEPGGRLVDDQQARIVEERLGDADPLPHPSREAAQGARADVGEIENLEKMLDARAQRAARYSFERPDVFEELSCR